MVDVAIVGQWTLYYDWGCDGTYGKAGITFNNDGTFTVTEDSETNVGKWAQNDGMILWQYDTIKTTYGGNFVKNVMVGMMSAFEGGNDDGCWYAIKRVAPVEKRKTEFDSTGKKAKQ